MITEKVSDPPLHDNALTVSIAETGKLGTRVSYLIKERVHK